MIEKFTSDFRTTSIKEWQTEIVVVLDWYDGPRAGFCRMHYPEQTYYFEVFADCYSEDEIEDHLFRIKMCTPEMMNTVIQLLSQFGEPHKPIWVPLGEWAEQTHQKIDSIIAQAIASPVVIQSPDMRSFNGCWITS